MYICTYALAHRHVQIHAIYTYTHRYTYTCVYMYVYIYVYMYVSIYVYMYISYTYICKHTYTRMYADKKREVELLEKCIALKVFMFEQSVAPQYGAFLSFNI